MAPFQSRALTLARTAVRSGAPAGWMESIAKALAVMAPLSSATARMVERRLVMASSPYGLMKSWGRHVRWVSGRRLAAASRRGGHEGVAGAVLGEAASPREREMRAADHHVVGDGTIEDGPARLHRERSILVVHALPVG